MSFSTQLSSATAIQLRPLMLDPTTSTDPTAHAVEQQTLPSLQASAPQTRMTHPNAPVQQNPATRTQPPTAPAVDALEECKQLLRNNGITDPVILSALSLADPHLRCFAQACVTLKSHLSRTPSWITALLNAQQHAEPLAAALLENSQLRISDPSSTAWRDRVMQLLIARPAHAGVLQESVRIATRWTPLQQQWLLQVLDQNPSDARLWSLAFFKLEAHQLLNLDQVERLVRAPSSCARAAASGLLTLHAGKVLDGPDGWILVEALINGLIHHAEQSASPASAEDTQWRCSVSTAPAASTTTPTEQQGCKKHTPQNPGTLPPFVAESLGTTVATQLVALHNQWGNHAVWPRLLHEAKTYPERINALNTALNRLHAQHIADDENVAALLSQSTRKADDPYARAFLDALLHLVPRGGYQQLSLLTAENRLALASANSNDPYAIAAAIRAVNQSAQPISAERLEQMIWVLVRMQTQHVQHATATTDSTPSPNAATFLQVAQHFAAQLCTWPELFDEICAAYLQANGDPQRHATIAAWYDAPTVEERLRRWLRLCAFPYGNRAQTLPNNTAWHTAMRTQQQVLTNANLNLTAPLAQWAAEALELQPEAYRGQLLTSMVFLQRHGLLTGYNLGTLLIAPASTQTVANALYRASQAGLELGLIRNLIAAAPHEADAIVRASIALRRSLSPPHLIQIFHSEARNFLLNTSGVPQLKEPRNGIRGNLPTPVQQLKALLRQFNVNQPEYQLLLASIAEKPECVTLLRAAFRELSKKLGSRGEIYKKYLLVDPSAALALVNGLVILHDNAPAQAPHPHLQMLLQAPAYAAPLANGIGVLTAAGLSTTTYLPVLLAQPHEALRLAEGLSSLNNLGLLTPGVRLRLQEKDPLQFLQQLINLHELKQSDGIPIYLEDGAFLNRIPLAEDGKLALHYLGNLNRIAPDLTHKLVQMFSFKSDLAHAFWAFSVFIDSHDNLTPIVNALTPLNLALIAKYPASADKILTQLLISTLETHNAQTERLHRELVAIEHHIQQSLRALNPTGAASTRRKRAIPEASTSPPPVDAEVLQRWGVDAPVELPDFAQLDSAIATLKTIMAQEHGENVQLNQWNLAIDSMVTDGDGIRVSFQSPPDPETGRIGITTTKTDHPQITRLRNWLLSKQKYISRAGHLMFIQSFATMITHWSREQQVMGPDGKPFPAHLLPPTPPLLVTQQAFSYLGFGVDILDELSTIAKHAIRQSEKSIPAAWRLAQKFLPRGFGLGNKVPTPSFISRELAKSIAKIRTLQGIFRSIGRFTLGVDIVLSSIQLAQATTEYERVVLTMQLTISSTGFGLSILAAGAGAAGLTATAAGLSLAATGVGMVALPVSLVTASIAGAHARAMDVATQLSTLNADYRDGFSTALRGKNHLYLDFQVHMDCTAGALQQKAVRMSPISMIDYRKPGVVQYAIDGATIHTMVERPIRVGSSGGSHGTSTIQTKIHKTMNATHWIPVEQWMGLPNQIERRLPPMDENKALIETRLPEPKAVRWKWTTEGHAIGFSERDNPALSTVRAWNRPDLAFEPSTPDFPFTTMATLTAQPQPPTPLTVYLGTGTHRVILPEAAQPTTMHLGTAAANIFLPTSGHANLTLTATETGFGTQTVIYATQTAVDPFDPSTLHCRNGILTIGSAKIHLNGAKAGDWIRIFMPSGVSYWLNPMQNTLQLEQVDLTHLPAQLAGATAPSGSASVAFPSTTSDVNANWAIAAKAEEQAFTQLKTALIAEFIKQNPLKDAALVSLKMQFAGRLPATVIDWLVSQWEALTRIQIQTAVDRWLSGKAKAAADAWRRTIQMAMRTEIDNRTPPSVLQYIGTAIGLLHRPLIVKTQFDFPFPEALSASRWTADGEMKVYGHGDPIRQAATDDPARFPADQPAPTLPLWLTVNGAPQSISFKYDLKTHTWNMPALPTHAETQTNANTSPKIVV